MTPTDTELIDRANRALAYGVPRTCAWCHKPFRVADFHPEQATCSRACQLARYRAARGHIPVGTPITLTCDGCATEYTALASRGRPRRWCDSCRPTTHRAGPRKPR